MGGGGRRRQEAGGGPKWGAKKKSEMKQEEYISRGIYIMKKLDSLYLRAVHIFSYGRSSGAHEYSSLYYQWPQKKKKRVKNVSDAIFIAKLINSIHNFI